MELGISIAKLRVCLLRHLLGEDEINKLCILGIVQSLVIDPQGSGNEPVVELISGRIDMLCQSHSER